MMETGIGIEYCWQAKKKVLAIYKGYQENKTIVILTAIMKKVSAMPSITIFYFEFRDIITPSFTEHASIASTVSYQLLDDL